MDVNQILSNMFSNPQMKNNPMVSNVFQMCQNHDEKGLKQMAENLCKEKGIDINQFRNKLGI